MFSQAEFRQMEYRFIVYQRKFGIGAGNIKFDGQVIWLERGNNV